MSNLGNVTDHNIEWAELLALRESASSEERTFTLELPLEQAWMIVSDMLATHAVWGHQPYAREVVICKDGKPLQMGTPQDPVPNRYYEYPWVWEENRMWLMERVFTEGMLRYMSTQITCVPDGPHRTLVTMVDSAVPTDPPVVSVEAFFDMHMTGAINTWKKIAQMVPQDRRWFDFGPHMPNSAQPDEAVIELAHKWSKELRLDSNHTPMLLHIAEFVLKGMDGHISRIRPFELADFYGLERLAVTQFFLRATLLGYFDMNWEILCPSCKGAEFKNTALDQFIGEVHCRACQIEYGATFDENVEVTFRPTAKVRKPEAFVLCAGSPETMRHLVGQWLLGPNDSLSTTLQLKPGTYRLQNPDGGRPIVVGDSYPNSVSIDVTLGTDAFDAKEPLTCNGVLRLNIDNPASTWGVLRLEDTQHAGEHAATAAYVSSLQDFRELFSSQILRPGLTVGVSNTVLFFSDLKDSTKLYEEQGDAAAFQLVQDHFDIMTKVIRKHSGGIVKTIGDAVMAVFTDAEDAALCAVETLQAFQDWNDNHPADRHIIIKMGLHQGPAVAMTSNDRLDFFGSTVNRAARVQGVSQGNDLLLSRVIANEPSVQKLLKQRPYTIDTVTAELKGIQGQSEMQRVFAERW